MNVTTTTFACDISIVGGCDERNGFRSTSEHVTRIVCQFLNFVRLEFVIVDDLKQSSISDDSQRRPPHASYHRVMRRTDCALKPGMCLKEEIKVVHRRYTSIDNSSCFRVGRPIGIFVFGRVEASVMPFSTDGDGNLRAIRLVQPPASLLNPRVLDVDNLTELALESSQELSDMLVSSFSPQTRLRNSCQRMSLRFNKPSYHLGTPGSSVATFHSSS